MPRSCSTLACLVFMLNACAGGGGRSEAASGAPATGGDTSSAGPIGLGGSSAGGSSAGGSSAGAAGVGAIDYSIWLLQLPIGSGTSPTTISPGALTAGYSSAYFYEAADGGQTFMDPATGVTTSGSQHCRTEMRESTPSGAQAAWSASGRNSMTVSGKVLSVGGGASGSVTVGQLFNGSDSIPLCELEYSTRLGGFGLLYEEAKGAGTATDLRTPVALDERYTFTLALTLGVLSVSINGQLVHTQTPSAAVLAKNFFFKFGNYDQTSTSGASSETPYTVVEAYSVAVVHR